MLRGPKHLHGNTHNIEDPELAGAVVLSPRLRVGFEVEDEKKDIVTIWGNERREKALRTCCL